jgi:hypothetical protein
MRWKCWVTQSLQRHILQRGGNSPSGSPLLAEREASYGGTETDTAKWTHRNAVTPQSTEYIFPQKSLITSVLRELLNLQPNRLTYQEVNPPNRYKLGLKLPDLNHHCYRHSK